MRWKAAVTIGALLALVVAASDARAGETWFAGAGIEAPRIGEGKLGNLNRDGVSLVVGAERALEGTTGVMVRATYSHLPVREGVAASFGFRESGDATLGTLVGGLRFRRRDLGFSPYFDLGAGLGLASVRRVKDYVPLGASTVGTSVSWVWSWGAGVAWHGASPLGVFVDGHWDTVPSGQSEHSWVAAVRGGLEWR